MIRTSIGPMRPGALCSVLLALGLLAGCEEGSGLLQAEGPNSSDGASLSQGEALEERDVEVPEVFQVAEAALWDGRPSLGGVWVAHPDVTEPQRVIIRNTANGESVVGALFRRERDVPGPRIQASSDAAEALAMLAGAPVQLEVTALVRAPAQDETTPDPAPAVAEDTSAATGLTSDTPPAATPAAAPASGVSNADPSAEPAKPGFRWPWQRRATAGAATVAAATTIDDETPPAAAATTVTTQPLESASSLSKPYIQIGIFSQEDNADRTATQMRAAGLQPTVREQASNGKTFWRVLVGPSRTRSEQSALLEKVQGTGFSDAYTVTN